VSGGPVATVGGSTGGSAGGASGNIYDLGYQNYLGPRLGRRHAVWALFVYSLRAAFGIGRGGRSKVVPFGLAFLALLPALLSVGVTALLNRAASGGAVESPIQYATLYGYSQLVLMLFCAAQAPELVGRDQRYKVLSLYFSRALRREDYALAKLAALVTAMLLVFLVPEAVIFVGRVLAASDVPAALADNLQSVPPIIAIAMAAALLLGGISLAIAALTPRRAYATAAIIAAFIVPPIVVGIVTEIATEKVGRWIVVLDPGGVLGAANAFLFGRAPANPVYLDADLPGPVYLATVAVVTVICVAALLRRYRRLTA
jgi:ABC-2 type transport system permease protein